MSGSTPLLVQLKKLSWLLLGFCFVVLYSCPVKKYLLLTFGNGRATETRTLQFQKDVFSHAEKIVYLRRQSAKSIVALTFLVVRPIGQPVNLFSVFSSIATDRDNCLEAIGRAERDRNRVTGDSPPRWLAVKRLLV